MKIIAYPGLHKKSGIWALAVGILRPVVIRDPLVETMPGGNALMIHEAVHVNERHALWGCVVLVVTLGLGYRWYRRRCEMEADFTALLLLGLPEFKSMLWMHPHPKTRWGKYLYGETREARIERTMDMIYRRAE